jgi:hypothetical protein
MHRTKRYCSHSVTLVTFAPHVLAQLDSTTAAEIQGTGCHCLPCKWISCTVSSSGALPLLYSPGMAPSAQNSADGKLTTLQLRLAFCALISASTPALRQSCRPLSSSHRPDLSMTGDTQRQHGLRLSGSVYATASDISGFEQGGIGRDSL